MDFWLSIGIFVLAAIGLFSLFARSVTNKNG
jgi:hypothetical protein